MIELTIILNEKGNQIEFEPFTQTPNLELMLLPSARIGRRDIDRDNVHLAPVAVHNFFNAVLFSHWLADANSLSEGDAFLVFLLHDMFKPLLHFVPKSGGGRNWPHSGDEFFQPIESKLHASGIFDDFTNAFGVAKNHMRPRAANIQWRETTWHEQGLDFESQANAIALSVMLEPALSNIFGIEYVKSSFIEAYVETLRQEYQAVFSKLDEVVFRYEFADTKPISKDPNQIAQDIALLCQESNVEVDGKQLRIESFIGAHSPVTANQHSRIRLPFWLLLVLHHDPTSIVFPVPVTLTSAVNQNFIDDVRERFKAKLETLFPTNLSNRKTWATKRVSILSEIDAHTFRVLNGSFSQVQQTTSSASDQVCSLCGSTIHKDFACSPDKDLGFSDGNYTDWHNHGDIDNCCALCAISNFKIPSVLAEANKLVGQRKLIYFVTTTPCIVQTRDHLEGTTQQTDVLPFFTAPITPRLEPKSLESLVTLNLIAALFLNSVKQLAEYRGVRGKAKQDTRLLWLAESFPVSPFAFIGTAGKVTAEPPAAFNLLKSLLPLLTRSVWLIDPIISAEIEVPFHALVSLAGIKNAKHFELKFKPLVVSNRSGNLPLIRDGFHFVDMPTLAAMEQIQSLLREFRPSDPIARKRLKDSMTVGVVAAGRDEDEFMQLMIEVGGFRAEQVIEKLQKLSQGGDPENYLRTLREQIYLYPIIREQWRK